MAPRNDSPLTRLSRRLRRQQPREGISGAVQRAAIALLPRPSAPPAGRPPIGIPTGGLDAGRLRARRALLEARQAMSGMLSEGSTTATDRDALGPPLPPDLDRLRAYLEESERRHATLRAELEELRRESRSLRERVQALERAMTAATPATGGTTDAAAEARRGGVSHGRVEHEAGRNVEEARAGAVGTSPTVATGTSDETEQPPAIGPARTERLAPEADDAAVRDLRERVLRALRDRVFAAGTVGTRVELSPPPDEEEWDAIIARLEAEPFVDSAEPIGDAGADASLRVTLRTPLRWEQFGALLERALGRQFAQGEVGWSHGAVRVRRGAARAGSGAPDGAADASLAAEHR